MISSPPLPAAPARPLPPLTALAPGRSPKSILLELAYLEYCDRLEAGEQVSPAEHCERFPHLRSSLRRVIDVHHGLEAGEFVTLQPVPEAWPEPGETFHGFDLLQELGRGTFGRVFLARQPDLGNRLVVAKVTARASREAAILGRLHHPNIVNVHSIQTAGLFRVLCMPYLGVATLCDVMDRAFAHGSCLSAARVIVAAARDELPQGLPPLIEEPADELLQTATYPEGVAHLGAQLADALAYAHGAGIYHRDLKPSNVLLTPGGRPMLLDFNLSQEQEQGGPRMGGTPAYMAPEQLELGQALAEGRAPLPQVDGRADLFSLGVVLYELLAGRSPFGPLMPLGSQPYQFLGDRLRSRLVPLRLYNPDIPATLEQVVLRCLATDPEQRWPSAAALAQALRACAQRPLIRRRRWHRVAAAVGALALLALAGTAGALLLSPSEQPPLTAQAPGPSPEELFNRGVRLVRQEQYADALADFERALKLSPHPHPKCMVMIGYCAAQRPMTDHLRAINSYKQAMDSGYPADAKIFNNLGYSSLQLGHLVEAARYFDAALKLDPDFATALHNQALVAFRQLQLKRDGRIPWNPAHLTRALEWIDKSLRAGGSADRYRDAGYLYALAAEQDSRLARKALDHFTTAANLGFDPKPWLDDTSLKHLWHEPRFQVLRSYPRPQGSLRQAPRLVNPLPLEGRLES